MRRRRDTAAKPLSNRRFFWNIARGVLVFAFVVLCVPTLVGVIGVGFRCDLFADAPQTQVPGQTMVPAAFERPLAERADASRPEDQTYLTFPEWYIVYSADEYAAFVADHPPSSFPYFGSITQFWGSYYDVCDATRGRYGFNGGYHLTLVVIGASFTVENTVRGLYENTIGRVTEWFSNGGETEEDAYAQEIAREYGTFIHTIPWYEFPFGEKLRGLWQTPAWGPNIVRKWERRLALSAEYGIKAAYGRVIGQGTQSVYEGENLTILAWVKGDEGMFAGEADVEIVAQEGENLLVELPRYEAFTQLVPRLAERGVRFVQIAGNDIILMTLIAPRQQPYDVGDGTVLWTMPILTEPTQQRIVLDIDVSSLSDHLRTLSRSGARLEHIYDY